MYKKKLILSAAILTLISFSALGCSSTKSSAPSDTKASSDTSSVSPAVSPTSAPSKTSSDAENKDKLTNKEDDNVKEESDAENIMTLQRKIIMIMKMLPLHSLRILPKKTIWMFQNTIRLKLILKRRDGPNLKINIE